MRLIKWRLIKWRKHDIGKAKGFKVFDSDWKCKGFQYEVGKTFEEDVVPSTCSSGFHFCEKAADCFNYYDFNPNNKVAEVLALGDVDTNGTKSSTNKIRIVREIPWEELLSIVNTGKACTGLRNTGDCNAGNWNTGNHNTGYCNTGDWNTGRYNTGNRNTGDWNTGNFNAGDCNAGKFNTGTCNIGDCNTGHHNTGDWNTGDWNKCNFSNGVFNTEEPKVYMFNKPTDLTYTDWRNCAAQRLLTQIPRGVVEWVTLKDMTDQEKKKNPTCHITGGYLRVSGECEGAQGWWNALSESDKQIIKDLPNFDAAVFKECTGIDVNGSL